MNASAAFSPAQAALLHDAVLAGLSFDLQEAPAVWLNQPAVVAGNQAKLNAPQSAAPLASPVPAVQLAAVVTPPASVSAPEVGGKWQVWQELPAPTAEAQPQATPAERVAVVVAAEPPLAGAAMALLANMLQAVGLQGATLAIIGLAGQASKSQQVDAKAALVAAVNATQPTRTLVLGQGVLGVCLGKLQGVEGWQAAPVALGFGGAVGVTFPLELLLNKPLFKSLSWQHLQAWQTQKPEVPHGA